MMVETMQIHDRGAAESHNPLRALSVAKDEILLTAHFWDSSTMASAAYRMSISEDVGFENARKLICQSRARS
jgi:hypothetical protein